MDQVPIKYTNIFHCKTLQNLPKFVFFFAWKQTIWQPCCRQSQTHPRCWPTLRFVTCLFFKVVFRSPDTWVQYPHPTPYAPMLAKYWKNNTLAIVQTLYTCTIVHICMYIWCCVIQPSEGFRCAMGIKGLLFYLHTYMFAPDTLSKHESFN
jgi:membrane-associated HD superfamily phosphohydrolase